MGLYEKTWESIDSRPLPGWFDEAKLGIFIHWGLYSVPAYAPKRRDVESTGLAYSEWYGWQIAGKYPPYYDFHRKVYGEHFRYEDFAGQWKAEMFDPDKWAKLFARAGAKYVVLVSKHHDGFCLWPSYYSWNWNSVDIGPHRDIVGELLDAAERNGLHRGLYYSLLEWFHPVMQVKDLAKADIPRYAVEKMIPQMKELVEGYRPDILFTDGEWSYNSEQWHSLDFITWLYNESSVRDKIVINDRWGSDTRGLHGGYLSCEYGEVNSPAVEEKEAIKNLARRKWEECRSIGASFGYNRNEDVTDYLSENQLIELLVDTVSRGGNLCLNVGPCADGTIAPLIQERLLQLGEWMDVNSEAIYGTSAARELCLPEGVRATKKGNVLYLFCNRYPKEELRVSGMNFGRNESGREEAVKAVLLGSGAPVACRMDGRDLVLQAPMLTVDELPCRNIYTFKIWQNG